MSMEQDERAKLEAQIAELTAENHRLKSPPVGKSGKLVVPIFFGLIALSMGSAFLLWTSARKTAIEREAREAEHKPPTTRVDAAGRAALFGIQQCLAEAPATGELSIKLWLKVAPAGTAGLIGAEVNPAEADLVPCIRRVPSNIRLPNEAGSAVGIEVTFKQKPATEPPGGVEAAWSWKASER